MGTVEDKVGLTVVKQFAIQQDDIGIASLVVGMANAAHLIPYLRGTAVIPLAEP